MAVVYSWDIKVFDGVGALLAQIMGAGTPEGSGAVLPSLFFPLNGIDTLTLTLYLDDPQLDPNHLDEAGSPDPGDPSIIRVLDRVVKVWRHVSDNTDPTNIITYDDDPDFPAFAGNITRIEAHGQSGQMTILCQNPYWRLNSRFHLLNHYLVVDHAGQDADGNHEGGNMDDEKFDVSALCFRLIDLINHAFGADSATGIVKPTIGPPFWPKTQTVRGGYRAAKGNNVWIEITDLLWNKTGGVNPPDLFPSYVHTLGSPDLMIFDTVVHRGDDISADVSFDFCTGNKNLDDIAEVIEVTPDNFANYVWAVGQAGPNVAKRTASSPPTASDYGYDEVGIYMFYSEEASEVVKSSSPAIQTIADAELQRRVSPPRTYEIQPSPLRPPYYATDKSLGAATGGHPERSFFTLGDVAGIKANKGWLQVNITQRIYEATLALSENCVESCQLRVTKDFFGKVAETE